MDGPAHNPFDDVRTVADIPRYHALHNGSAAALVFEDRVSTYAEWNDQCSRVANGLRARGVECGDRIAFLGKNSDWFFEILFGAAKAGVTLAPINWRLAVPEVSFIVEDSDPRIIFVEPDYLPIVRQAAPGIPVILLGSGNAAMEPYLAWRDRQSNEDAFAPIAGDRVIVQLYTSGTTGMPKGAMLTSDNLILGRHSQCDPRIDFNRWANEDSTLIAMPAFHIGGTGWAMTGLFCGIRNVILPEFDAKAVLDAINDFQVSRLFLVPAAVKILIEHPDAAATDFSSLKYMMYGGSPIPLELLRKAIDILGCRFAQLYGSTETGGSATYLPTEDHDLAGNARMRSAGRPFPGLEAAVADADGRMLPAGETGEILIRGAQVMAAYWNRPRETEKSFIDGWFRTGDAGFMDEGGYIYIQDRVKDMILSGGENVYPAEVENAIFGHEAVADVVVIGVPDDRWGEAVKAIVVVKPGTEPSPQDIIAYARQRIAAYKAPKTVDFIDVLPRNPGGKILRRVLRDQYRAAASQG